MPVIQDLLANNRRWAESRASQDPDFFPRLSRQQNPDFLWIGCADSRVPANEIVGMDPGELFVHRNVANLVLPSDLNCLAVIQYAVEVLNVEHIIVCGHYGCGGVCAAMQDRQLGLIDNWLQPIRRLCERHGEELAGLADETARADRLCELNVLAQARSVATTTIVQNAWHRRQSLAVHAWIYALEDGLVRDLGETLRGIDDLAPDLRLQALE
ncbi:MAG: carbonate dehydratase [Gammaproteobacteria bacterium]|nr:carbonate dehydratase [Gammaproteobacteria bacterium]